VLRMAHRGAQVLTEPRTLGLTERRRLFQRRLSLLSKRGDVFAQIKELLFGLANQFDEDFALATTAATKAAHDFAEALLQVLHVGVQSRAATTARLGDVDNEVERFFCALYSVVASVTR